MLILIPNSSFYSISVFPGTMSPFITTACLLMLLSCPIVSCERSPFPQGDREQHRLAKEEHRGHRDQTARKVRAEVGRQSAVIDVSDDMDHKPDSAGEYTGASLTKPGMPADFTICLAFRTEAWTKDFSGGRLFQLNGKYENNSGWVSINADSSYTRYYGKIGKVNIPPVTMAIVFFSITWTRVCVSLNTNLGKVFLW